MGDIDFRGAYSVLKSWYHHLSARSLNPYQANMDKSTKDYATLYQHEDPYPWPTVGHPR